MLWILKVMIGLVLTSILGVVAIAFGAHRRLPRARDPEEDVV